MPNAIARMLTYYEAHHKTGEAPIGEKKRYKQNPKAKETFSRKITNITLRTVIGDRNAKTVFWPNAALRAELDFALRLIRFNKNVCFHGFGRKEPFLRGELAALSDTREIVFVSGNQLETLPHTIFIRLLEAAESRAREVGLGVPRSAENDIESLPRLVYETLENVPSQRFLVVLFGADGPNFARAKVLEAFAKLVALPNFRVVLTFDTANAAAILSRKTADALGLIYFALHTRIPYSEELLYVEAGSAAAVEARSAETILSILHALTANQQALVRFVLRRLRDSPQGCAGERELFAAAVGEAKVTSMLQFGENLSEALWHRLIVKKRNSDCVNVYQTHIKREVLDKLFGAESSDESADASNSES